ncbi:hypothetical protein NHQ30_004001 [Ciborinia camelliae]|nr:hypothetical protein NHQ30_004001 [Ciborinia camelliae]
MVETAGETIDYQALDDITFNPEFDDFVFNPNSVSIFARGDENGFAPLPSNESLSYGDGADIFHTQTNSTQKLSARSPTWGIHWKKPSFIALMLVLGLALSLTHHFYYLSLSNETTGDEKKQAWPTRIGTGLAFLVTSCLKAATTAALGQYVWRVVKHQPFTMIWESENLDRLFALSTDPMAMFSLELLKGAKLALVLGIITWLLGLASVAPPATLTIVARNISQEVRLPVLDFSKSTWNNSMNGRWNAVSVTNTIAINTASNINVLELTRQVSGSEWSYNLQFYGPSIKCNEPNSTEQAVFMDMTEYYEQHNIFTYYDRNDHRTNATFGAGSSRLVYASWSQASIIGSFISHFTPRTQAPALYLNLLHARLFIIQILCIYPPFAPRTLILTDHRVLQWYAAGTPNTEIGPPLPFKYYPSTYPQLWIQTSTSELVCTAVNASFNIAVSYVDGVQYVTQTDIEIVGKYNISYASVGDIVSGATVTDSNGTITASAKGGLSQVIWNEYISHMYALGGILGGNITLNDKYLTNSDGANQFYQYGASNILGAGLMACDEIANTPFKNENSWVIGNASTAFTNTFTSTTQPWLCRNRTLARGIEDLANNITISYLSSPDLTSDSVLQNIVTSNTNNYYVYRPLWLLLSYGLAILFSTIAVVVGVYAMHSNGVVHSNYFSAIVATTRNPELDECLGRSSLGADPLQRYSESRRLRFGPMLNQTITGDSSNGGAEREGQWQADEKIAHVAFGLEQNIGQLRKGELYI